MSTTKFNISLIADKEGRVKADGEIKGDRELLVLMLSTWLNDSESAMQLISAAVEVVRAAKAFPEIINALNKDNPPDIGGNITFSKN